MAQMPINFFLKASKSGDSDDQEKIEKEKIFLKIQSKKKRKYADEGRGCQALI